MRTESRHAGARPRRRRADDARHRAGRVRRGQTCCGSRRSTGRRSGTTRCWCACTRPGSTRAPGTSWPACRTRSAWRATGSGRRRTRVRGREVAGRVEAVGKDVTTLRPGDEVLGIGEGSLRRVRRRRRGQARAQAGEPHLPRRRRPSRSPASPPCRRSATRAGCSRDSRCWSSARPAASARSPCRSPRRSAPRSPGCAARPRSTWSGPSARTTSSTTPRDDVAAGDQRYDVILDTGGNRRCRAPARAHADRDARHRRRPRPAGGGSAASTVSCGRCCCRRSSASGSARSSPRRTRRTSSCCAELVESGKVTPAVDRTFPLAETPAAVRYMREGHARGKVVIEV